MNRPVAFVLAVVLVGAGVALLWRNAPRRPDAPDPRGVALSRQASERFDRANRVEASAPAPEIASQIAATPTVGPPPENDAAHRAFAQWLAGFFKARAEGTASAYAAWAESNRLVRAAIDDNPDWTRRQYEACTDEPLPPGATPGSLFELFFDCHLRLAGGNDIPVAVATGDQGAKIWFAEIRYGDSVPPMPTHLLEDASTWLGSRGINNRQVWLPVTPLQQIIERDGTALVARAFVGTRSRSGVWYTTMVAAFYDPVSEQWMLDKFAIQNTFNSSIGAPPY